MLNAIDEHQEYFRYTRYEMLETDDYIVAIVDFELESSDMIDPADTVGSGEFLIEKNDSFYGMTMVYSELSFMNEPLDE